ncbi:MAG: LytR/AlgR family response regulator transcription factor [Rhodoferax sp.]
MPLSVLLVDDETLARARLRALLADCGAPQARVEAEAANAVQAMLWLQRRRFDLALIDIHMPGADGLTLARGIRALPEPPAVIFVTAHAEHAVQAFELEALDYLTKPVRLERLQIALQKVQRALLSARGPEPEAPQEVLIIQERGRTERVPLTEVLYLKAELKYITVRTQDRSYLLEGSLTELEAKYPQRLMRIHRNALVAVRALRALERQHDAPEGEAWALRLKGIDELLPVSRRQLAAVRELLASLCF